MKNKSNIVMWKLENSFQIPALAKAMGISSCRSHFFSTAHKLKTRDLHTMVAKKLDTNENHGYLKSQLARISCSTPQKHYFSASGTHFC
jgi:hypothetical protein